MIDIPSFIKQKREEKQNDSLILEELVALGFDRNEALKQLAGVAAVSQSAPTSNQTGGVGMPTQVENVQYNVTMGKVRSKIGFAAFICALCAWVMAWVAVYFLTSLRQTIFPSVAGTASDVSGTLVLTIAFLVPIIPLFIFTRKRLNKMLAEDPKNVDDLSFKKSIRFHLVVSILLALGWAIAAVYNVLAKLFLRKEGLSGGAVLDSIIFALVFCVLVYFFWTYQRQTKR